MKPTWDRLMEEFASSPTALIADVDCTAEGEELCTKHNIEGYPTLKYGDPSNLQDYEGEIEYDDLLAFAQENLGPTCGPKNLDLCDEEQKAKIAAFEAEGVDALEARLSKIHLGIEAADKTFEEEVQKLHDTYEGLMEELQKATKELKGDDWGLFNSVYKHLKPEEEHDESGEGSEGYEEYGEEEHDPTMDGYDESPPDGSDESPPDGYDDSTAKGHEDL